MSIAEAQLINRLLDTKSDLKRVDYKIKNDMTDNIYFMINDLIKSIKETTTSKDLTEKIEALEKSIITE